MTIFWDCVGIPLLIFTFLYLGKLIHACYLIYSHLYIGLIKCPYTAWEESNHIPSYLIWVSHQYLNDMATTKIAHELLISLCINHLINLCYSYMVLYCRRYVYLWEWIYMTHTLKWLQIANMGQHYKSHM